VTQSPSTTIEEIANTMSAAAARAMAGLREVSDATAKFREAEMMLRSLAAREGSPSAKSTVPLCDPLGTSQTIALEDRRSSDRDTPWRINELAEALKVSRSTIERRITDGTLKAFKVVGITLIDAESVKAMFEPQD
jgi:excisionase family DNA binding protein